MNMFTFLSFPVVFKWHLIITRNKVIKMTPLLFLLFAPFVFFAQEAKTDTAKASILIAKGRAFYKKKNYAQASYYYEQALILDERHKNYDRFFQVKNHITIIKRELREYDVATQLANEIIKESRALLGVNNKQEAVAYNTLAIIKSVKNEYDEAIRIHKKVLSIYQKNNEEQRLCATYNNLAIAYCLKNDFETGLRYFKQNEICITKFGKKGDFASLYNNSAALHWAIGNKEEALEYMLKAVAITAINNPDDWKETARQYTNCSVICQELQQPNRALDYLGKAERLLEDKEDKLRLAQTYNAKAMIYEKKGYVEIALLNYEKERKLREEEGTELLLLALCYVNLMGNYGKLNHKEKFEEYSAAAIEIYKQVEGDNKRGLARCYESMAIAYTTWDMVEERGVYFEKALTIYHNIYGGKHPDVARLYTTQGAFWVQKRAYEKAEMFLKKALAANLLNNQPDLKTLIDNKAYLDINELQRTLGTLQLLYNDWYRSTKTEAYLEQSYKYSLLAQQILFTQREALAQNEDKKTLLAKAHNIVANMILTAQEYYSLNSEQKYIETALQAAEKSKSIILLESLKGSAEEKFGGLPEHIQKEETNLKKEIAALEKQIIDAKEAQENTLQNELKNQLFDQKRALEKLYERIKSEFPKYVEMKQGGTNFDLEAFKQNVLDDETALLEYFISDSSCYLFVITKKESQFLKLPITSKKIGHKVAQFRTALSDYEYILKDKKRAYQQYTKTAHWFYKELFAAAIPYLKGIEHLILVPDGTLGHLPFDVFLVEKPSEKLAYSQLHYLLQDYSIRYSYSAALLLENKKGQAKRPLKKDLNLYAFAASYDALRDTNLYQRTLLQQEIRKQLSPLPAVVSELNQLEKLFKEGHYYYGAAATEHNFKAHAAEMDVLHLAMHGILNKNHPFASSLAFTENRDSLDDNFLYAYEISQLNLNASLVVLSACETGYGRFDQGEGVLSLARSFMYAGVPSLVVSLWQVNDASTALIMQGFYTYLKAGLPKDVALGKAKLDYLKGTIGIAAHPAYWAPFIQLGTAAPLQEKLKSRSWWWLGGLVLLAGISFFILKRRTV
ncbi:MAG: Unknown protein [uncultured Aureispira sp.]|uniref:CHAT domain-containing protein n=1 Tax=uncultured Aureispira sp. TaxID=1331704 RepID=A0A6S6UK49_9BACT|nr:MAG: Unknown protein [uncultured Aureispira sp.]